MTMPISNFQKSIFNVKNYSHLSHFFFIKEYQFRGMFFVVDIFWKLWFLKHFVYWNHAYFSITWFKAYVDLTKEFFCEKVLFITVWPIFWPYLVEGFQKFTILFWMLFLSIYVNLVKITMCAGELLMYRFYVLWGQGGLLYGSF